MAQKRKTAAPKTVRREPTAPKNKRSRAAPRVTASPAKPSTPPPKSPEPPRREPRPDVLGLAPTKVGVEDLIIRSRDGKQLFWVTQETYSARPLPEELTDLVGLMADLGTVVADVPPDSPGVGAACILLNLSCIKRPATIQHERVLAATLNKLRSRR